MGKEKESDSSSRWLVLCVRCAKGVLLTLWSMSSPSTVSGVGTPSSKSPDSDGPPDGSAESRRVVKRKIGQPKYERWVYRGDDDACYLCGGERMFWGVDEEANFCVECDNRDDLHGTWFLNFADSEGP